MRFLYLSLAPLFERLRRGEGALFLVTGAIVGFGEAGLATGLAQVGLSFGVLAALYALNDLCDAEADRKDPDKNQRLVERLVAGRRRFALELAASKLVLAGGAWALLGARAALVTVSLYAVNALYSLWIKGVPVADVLWVGLWGFLYAAIVEPPWRLCALVGVMTAIAHVFQTLSDRDVDAVNRIRTTAVFSPGAARAVLGLACAALYAGLWPDLGAAWAGTAFVPLALHLGVCSNTWAWSLSRVYFGLALLAILGGLDGRP